MANDNKKLRKARLRQVSGLYKPHPDTGDGCVYCGIPADSVDHVPAVSLVADWGLGWVERNGFVLYLYPACNECNSILSNKQIFDIEDRRQHVKAKLRKRYAKVLRAAKMDDDELEEFGWTLKQALEAYADVREWVLRRLAW